jgi:hypothetical protein
MVVVRVGVEAASGIDDCNLDLDFDDCFLLLLLLLCFEFEFEEGMVEMRVCAFSQRNGGICL